MTWFLRGRKESDFHILLYIQEAGRHTAPLSPLLWIFLPLAKQLVCLRRPVISTVLYASVSTNRLYQIPISTTGRGEIQNYYEHMQKLGGMRPLRQNGKRSSKSMECGILSSGVYHIGILLVSWSLTQCIAFWRVSPMPIFANFWA